MLTFIVEMNEGITKMKTTTFAKIALTGVLIFVCMPTVTRGQPAKMPCRKQAYSLHSGVHDGRISTGEQAISVFRRVVQVPNASWLRLCFGNCELAEASYIRITSLEDGAYQNLDAVSLKQWHNTSAFFNGDAVEVELYVAPKDQGVFFEIQEVMLGDRGDGKDKLNKTLQDPCAGWFGICGDFDDRISSNDPAISRISMIDAAGDTVNFCTGWIGSNGSYLTAGHCFMLPAYLGGQDVCIDNPVFRYEVFVLEFNVRQSNSDGRPNWSDPNDQYVIDESRTIFCNTGVGTDWAVYSCFPNSNTGLLPVEAQDAFYRLTIDHTALTAPTLRVTGHGLDECPYGTNPPPNGNGRNSNNLTQQTSIGQNNGESGSGSDVYWSFSVDLRNGNSGSPIIVESTDLSIGIVTHAPCPNIGTSFENDQLEDIVNTHLGTDVIYVDNGHPFATGAGTVFRPYITVAGAVSAVPVGGTVSIVRGSYSESMTINRALTLTAPVGNVTIGPGESPKVANDGTQSEEGSLTNASFPTQYGLSQNYPNPFNPETTIEYALPKPAFVKFKVYNIFGQEVRTLVNEFQQAGLKSIVWDGKNNLGQAVTSGVYIYRIAAGDFTKSFRLVLLK